MKFNKSKVKKIFVFILLIFSISTCKNEVIDIMPNVHFTAYVSSGELANLGVTSAILKDGGYGGLIIYRKNNEEYLAFERLCTYYPNDTAIVVLDKDQQTATCPKCKSTFLLSADGYKNNNGPAKLPLKQYSCIPSPNRLTIVN